MSARLPRIAHVFRESTRVGTIARTTAGSTFTYDASFAAKGQGIAYRLPSRLEPFDTRGVNLHPFFAGLLPEGARLRALVRRTKTSEDDLLSLMVAAGADCIGDVSVVGPGDTPGDPSSANVEKLGKVLFADLFAKSIASRHEPTISGVQEKVSASMISFPLRAQGTAYILKLNPIDKPRLVENEHFFLEMAKACGLEVARASLVHDREKNAGLLVERFDRITEGEERQKVHQEDACQFLDRYPADKYTLTCAEIADGIAELSSLPIIDLARLLRLIAFSYVIANGDLHAKNISLATSPTTRRIGLTPAYDLLSTLPYGDRTMALQMDGRDDNLKAARFVEFGARHGVRERATLRILEEICDRAPPFVERLEEIGLAPKKTADLMRVMKKRRDHLRAG